MRDLERQILLQIIDNRWREHLYEMDYLREGIHLRGFAQIDPLVAYKNEGFSMFEELMASIWEEFTRVIFHVEVNIEPAAAERRERVRRAHRTQRRRLWRRRPSSSPRRSPRRGAPQPRRAAPRPPRPTASAATGTAGNGGPQPANPATVVKTEQEKIGRNDPCWCGSGKKYKKCHGA